MSPRKEVVGGGKRGGEEEKETEGTRGREKEKPALIQSMGSIFAEVLGCKGGIRMRAGGAGVTTGRRRDSET